MWEVEWMNDILSLWYTPRIKNLCARNPKGTVEEGKGIMSMGHKSR